MLVGISDDLRSLNDLWKTAVINNGLLRLDINIVALQGTRLAEEASMHKKDYYTFDLHRRPKKVKREHGFAVKDSP